MKYTTLAVFLLTALYIAPVPAPDFRPVEIDMAQACATVSPPICSTRPGDHTYLKTPKFLPQPTVHQDTAEIGPFTAVLLTILMTIGNLTGRGIYRYARDFHRNLTRKD